MNHFHLVTGGQRSGKSRFAQQTCETLSEQKAVSPVYLATAHRDGEADFEQRIARHQQERGEQWQTKELLAGLDQCRFSAGQVVMLDCITLWLSQIFFQKNSDVDMSMAEAKRQWSVFIEQPVHLVAVTNEIGMGVIPMEPLSRRFVDLQGWMNQWLASQANCVDFMVSGLPMNIKGKSAE